MNTINRRTVLRSMGAVAGLPFLEAMLPRVAGAQVSGQVPLRIMYLYAPGGMIMPEWTPEGEGKDWKLSKTLEPLAKVKEEVLVLSGLDGRTEDGGNGHDRGCGPWLSSAPVGQRDRAGYATDTTIDQLAAQKLGQDTRLQSLELGCCSEPAGPHTSNISWRKPDSPMGKETDPRAVFARLFGSPEGNVYQKSILDHLRERVQVVRSTLGTADQHKMDEYLDSVRSIERRIQTIEKNPNKRPAPSAKVPDAVPEKLTDHIRLLMDLAALGFQSDATRVITFMFYDEDRTPAIPEIGLKDRHHALAHNEQLPNKPAVAAKDKEMVEGLLKFDRFFVEQFAYLVEKLRSIPEGNGTLLDHSILVFGSGLSWGGLHWRTDLPLVVAGRGGGTIKPGRHLKYPKGTPFANLHLSVLERVGIPREKVANSTGTLGNLA